MSVFLRRFIENKKYILIAMGSVFICGICFGFYQYHVSSQMISHFFSRLFYLNVEGYDNTYQQYIIQNGIYILICTYLSSSYLGHLGLLFLLFLKGMQLSFSLLMVFLSLPFSFLTLLLILIEAIIEIALCISLNLTSIHISTYVTLVTFYTEQNFNIKSMLNYKLNCLIISLIIFSLSLAFRIYIIPMF